MSSTLLLRYRRGSQNPDPGETVCELATRVTARERPSGRIDMTPYRCDGGPNSVTRGGLE